MYMIPQKKLTFLFAFLLLSILSIAQKTSKKVPEKCATMQVLESRLAKNPQLRLNFEKERQNFRKAVASKAYRSIETINNSGSNNRTITTIPVVFHIVTTNPNSITDAQIRAQLDTLNKDFAGANGDSVLIPSYFKSLYGKSGIQFCLAQRTPSGNATTGIERVTTSTAEFNSSGNSMKHSSTGGTDIWDGDKYFNVWVVGLAGSALGFATFPNDGVPYEQGVVIDYTTLPGGSQANYNSGKTLTHETGHYFNLYHIWGDDETTTSYPFGTCFGSDDVDDTPNQSVSTGGCFTGIRTDSCTRTGNGVMYQNFMDYSYDRCLVMFTKAQVTRMEDAVAAYRRSLLSSNGCLPITPKTYNVELTFINQPIGRLCTNSVSPIITIRNRGGQTLTSLVVNTRVDNGAVTTYTWTGSLANSATTTITLNNFTTGSGNHTLTIYTTRPNNNQDEDVTNDTLTTRYQYNTPATAVSESFETTTFPPAAWWIVNPFGGTTWERSTNVAKTGIASAQINNYSNSAIGEKDDLLLPNVTLQNIDSAFLSFQVAAATFTPVSQTGNNWDTLEVLASTDCGLNYTSLYKKWGSTLVTRQGATSEEFVPTSNEWRKDSVDLSSLIGQGNVLLTFRNTNGNENNIYLDDVNLRTVVVNPNLKRTGFLITPNPTSSLIAVQFYPQPTDLMALQIYSITGQKLREVVVNDGQANNYYSFDLSAYAAGTYIVRAVFSDRVIMRQIFKY